MAIIADAYSLFTKQTFHDWGVQSFTVTESNIIEYQTVGTPKCLLMF